MELMLALSYLLAEQIHTLSWGQEKFYHLVAWANDTRLETVECLKKNLTIISDDGSKAEVLNRMAQTTAAQAKLQLI